MRVSERFSMTFNDKSYSDVEFRVDGNSIYVQKLYLKSICKHFDDMFNDKNWLESNSNVIEISQYSYSVYYSFLKYLYTSIVDIEFEEVINLFDLANSYFEDELKNECIIIIKNGITIENVCHLYSSAVKYNSQELEYYCVNFALNKSKLITNTEGFKQMDEMSAKKFFYRLSNSY